MHIFFICYLNDLKWFLNRYIALGEYKYFNLKSPLPLIYRDRVYRVCCTQINYEKKKPFSLLFLYFIICIISVWVLHFFFRGGFPSYFLLFFGERFINSLHIILQICMNHYRSQLIQKRIRKLFERVLRLKSNGFFVIKFFIQI